ncbi:MAG: citrate synthase [Methylococcaceae bacterium]
MTEKRVFTLQENSKVLCELPVLEGTTGSNVLDIKNLYSQTGMFAYDPGFNSTASCASKITFVDDQAGELFYRGYSIEQLVENCSFLEVSFVLLYGELPSSEQLLAFEKKIITQTLVHDQLINFFKGFRRDAHPMAVMVGVVGALSAFYHDALDIQCAEDRELNAIRLIAKIPTIVAMCYKYSVGLPFMQPQNKLSYVENFMRMLLATPCEEFVANPVLVRALENFLILHADHEQNASTSTVRLAGSSGANPYACITAGIACLWGSAHGGANEAVLNMFQKIGTPSNVSIYIDKVKDENDSFKLSGVGHQVYKKYDPRAKIMRELCFEVLGELNLLDDPLFQTALEFERIVLEDAYFVSREMYPKIDFYSGILLRALGIPTNMFTAIFAMARSIGWISQWDEMISDPNQRIGRPRQLYCGVPERNV